MSNRSNRPNSVHSLEPFLQLRIQGVSLPKIKHIANIKIQQNIDSRHLFPTKKSVPPIRHQVLNNSHPFSHFTKLMCQQFPRQRRPVSLVVL